MAEERGLLVTREPGERHLDAADARAQAVIGRRRSHLRQAGARDAQQVEHVIVPLAGAQAEQQRAARVADVGDMVATARELPGEPGVDGAEAELAAFGARPRALDVVEQPGELGAGEIRIEQQAGARGDLGLMSRCAQLRTKIGGAAVLPDDGVRHRYARRAVPEHRGLALVGDADRGDVGRRRARGLQHLVHRGRLRRPDLEGVVLDLPGCREVLRELPLRHGDDAALGIEQDGARTRGALVEGEDVAAHAGLLRRASRGGCCQPERIPASPRAANQSATACGAEGGRCRPSLLRRHSTSSALRAHSTSAR